MLKIHVFMEIWNSVKYQYKPLDLGIVSTPYSATTQVVFILEIATCYGLWGGYQGNLQYLEIVFFCLKQNKKQPFRICIAKPF